MTEIIEIHGSAVAISQSGVLILGRSGAGKSSLMLRLMAMGAEFIGDDRIVLVNQGEQVLLQPHRRAANQFEIRGIGIATSRNSVTAPLELVVDMDAEPRSRLPQMQYSCYFDKQFIKIAGKSVECLAEFLMLYMKQHITWQPIA